MCKFMKSLSNYSASVGIVKRNPNLEMFLQPCKDENTYYRVRLIGFEPSSGNRTDPHIVRHVHKMWATDQKTGKKHLEKIVCTRHTPWVETEGPKASSCKICNYVNQQWAIYNESGKTDVEARTNASKLGSNYEAIVPVYVKNDPNYERNNGKLKVIIFTDKEKYESFRKAIQKKEKEVACFNGDKAVDVLIHVGVDEITTKAGKIYKNPVIDKIKFSTNPYEIPSINSKLIDSFPYDSTYYSTPDQEDVDEFYNKYCAVSNDDIPEDDVIEVYKSDETSKKSEPEKVPTNDIPNDSDDISNDDIDELVTDSSSNKNDVSLKNDPDDEGLDAGIASAPKVEEKPNKNDDIDDDFLKELGL